MQDTQPPTAATTRLSRRTALFAGLAALATASWWRFPTAKDPASQHLRTFAERMVRVLGLHQTSPARQPFTHKSLIFSDAELTHTINGLMQVDVDSAPEVFALSDESLRTHLRTMIINDYRAGAIVQLHGWWLSKTESLCLKLLEMR